MNGIKLYPSKSDLSQQQAIVPQLLIFHLLNFG